MWCAENRPFPCSRGDADCDSGLCVYLRRRAHGLAGNTSLLRTIPSSKPMLTNRENVPRQCLWVPRALTLLADTLCARIQKKAVA